MALFYQDVTSSKETPPARWPLGRGERRRGRRDRRFAAGFVTGILVLMLARAFLNATPLMDWMVAPILLPDTAGPADAMVILGAGISGDCTPNQSGTQRVLLGARLFREGRAPVVIITGGPPEATCPIAMAMQSQALEFGMAPDRLYVETASRSTRENAERTAPILRGLGVRRVLLVTDRLHMRRAAGSFAALGFEIERAGVPVYAHTANNVALGISGLREALALAYYGGRGWLTPAPAVTGALPVSDASEQGSMVTGTQWEARHPDGPLAVLGASYAAGWQPASIGGVPVVNLGVGGQQSFEMLERFERDVVPLAPRAVILWGFINDIFRAPPGQLDASLERVRASYRRMFELARQHGIEPILATEITVRPDDSWRELIASWVNWLRGKESFQDNVNRHVIETNRWLADFARQEGVLVLDFQAALGESGGQRRAEFVDSDGSHVSDAGYAALTNYARPVLEKHVARR